jgi:hypothetical protein
MDRALTATRRCNRHISNLRTAILIVTAATTVLDSCDHRAHNHIHDSHTFANTFVVIRIHLFNWLLLLRS